MYLGCTPTVLTYVSWSTEATPRFEVGLDILDAWFKYVDLGVFPYGGIQKSGYWEEDCKTFGEVGGAFATYAAYTAWPGTAFNSTPKQLTEVIAEKLKIPSGRAWRTCQTSTLGSRARPASLRESRCSQRGAP